MVGAQAMIGARVMAIGDTHLGRVLYGYDLTPDILRCMYAFHEMCVARRVDVAVHLGDVFDRPTPAEYHRKVFVQWCNLFERAGIALRVLVGNHDAMSKPGAASALEAFKVTPWKHVEMIDRPTREGSLFYLPWPAAAIYEDREDWLQDIFTAQAKLEERTVAFAHLMPPGAVVGDQEWLYRGGEHVVPAPLLEDDHLLTLVAGHVHRPQEVLPGILTSGSAIRLRFDEARQHRYFVEVDDGRYRWVRHNHAPVLRELPVDASAWGTGGNPPTTADVTQALPSVAAEIVKVVPYVDDASAVDWPEVEAALYRAGAAHVHVATPIPVKRKKETERKALSPTDMDGAARAFIVERIADKQERRSVMRLFKQLRKQVQEDADG